MTNKEIVKKGVDAFLISDIEEALTYMTDDVVMGWPGYFDLAPGKNAIREFFKNIPEMLEWKIGDFIEEGNKVAATGWIKSNHNGEIKESYFCDIYTLENGKIKKLTSYMVFAQPKG
jgi:ketosteroid isomerase-like protein